MRKRKVVGLHGLVPPCGEPDAATVEMATDLLRRAKAGEVVGFAIVFGAPGDQVGTSWGGSIDFRRLIYGMRRLEYRMLRRDQEERDESDGHSA